MKLHDFFATAARAVPAPTRPVKFRACGHDAHNVRLVADVEAELAFVDEKERSEALAEAHAELAKRYHGEIAPDERRADEEAYHTLLRALREPGTLEPLCRSVIELKTALVLPEALRLWSEYKRFEREEFPPAVDEEEFAALVEEAKKKSLGALLSSSSSTQIRTVWPSLVAHFGRFPMPTSSDSEPSK